MASEWDRFSSGRGRGEARSRWPSRGSRQRVLCLWGRGGGGLRRQGFSWEREGRGIGEGGHEEEEEEEEDEEEEEKKKGQR